MRLPSLEVIFLIFFASELALALSKRAGGAAARDRLSLPLLWMVISGGIWLAFFCQARFPAARMPAPHVLYSIGIVMFVLGLVVRWLSIIYLGRFFTVDVAIAEDHKLISDGPYRYVRHPSYSGLLLIFVGLGLCLLNFYAMIALLLPVAVAFAWRIHVEESALHAAFGDNYEAYAKRTRRVIPWLY